MRAHSTRVIYRRSTPHAVHRTVPPAPQAGPARPCRGAGRRGLLGLDRRGLRIVVWRRPPDEGRGGQIPSISRHAARPTRARPPPPPRVSPPPNPPPPPPPGPRPQTPPPPFPPPH